FNLMAGDLYVNIHTSAFLLGEIRGQIVQSELIFALCITGDQADAGIGTGSDHLGFGVLALSKDCATLRVHVEHDIPADSVIDSHIHLGSAGTGGPIQFGFASSVSPIIDSWALSTGDVQNLLDGNLYVNLHSSLFPAGEIRGQIPGVLTTSAASFYPTFEANLDGPQADACVGTGSPHTGTATLELKKGGKELTVSVTHSIPSDSIIDSHIHDGDSCVGGPIVFGFANSVSVIEDIWYLDESDVIELLQGGLYVNLHSLAFNAGEIRGQIAKPGPPQACCNIPGDADDGGDVNIGDAIFIVKYAFVEGSPKPPCCDQADADGGGDVNIGDAIYIVKFAFVEDSPAPLCPASGPLECL
ncbi:MAG: CHRD domain-containing protein, partial [candidate division Zixibacteria bacterium]|nr:CHRD domain-containing protein [candidate division Zixibacteria bacterium]